MQVQQKLFTKLYLPILEKLKFHNLLLKVLSFSDNALCCLAFLLFLCSVFKVHLRVNTLKIEQCKRSEKADLKIRRSGYLRVSLERR